MLNAIGSCLVERCASSATMGNALALDESNVIVTDDPLLEVRMSFNNMLVPYTSRCDHR